MSEKYNDEDRKFLDGAVLARISVNKTPIEEIHDNFGFDVDTINDSIRRLIDRGFVKEESGLQVSLTERTVEMYDKSLTGEFEGSE